MPLLALIAVPLLVIAWARSARVTLGLAVTAAAMWTSAAVLAHWFFNQPEIFATLVFAYLLLPFVLAPLTGVLAALLIGARRHWFACAGAGVLGCVAGLVLIAGASSGPIVSMRECFREMAGPALLSASASALTAALAKRRA